MSSHPILRHTPARNLFSTSVGKFLIRFSAHRNRLSRLSIIFCTLLLSLLLPGCGGRRATSVLEAPALAENPVQTHSTHRNFDLQGPFTRNDTLFLRDWLRIDTTYDYINSCRVYVEKKTPESLGSILSKLWEESYWQENLALLKQRHPAPFRSHDLHDCPTTWIPVNSFRDSLYVDIAFDGPVWLSDTLFVRQTQEGPWPTPLQSIERPGANHYRLLTTDNEQLDIHIIDTLRRIAVFTFRNPGNSPYHSLYAPIETARKLSLVIWDCSEIPDYNDVAWDKPDYDSLISTAQSADNKHNEKQ